MRKALPTALGIVVSCAMLGFGLRHGLEISKPGVEVEFPGWQYTTLRWGLIGAAVVLGLVAAVWALRRSRRLEGEGLLVVVPAILAGLLLSGATSAAAAPAEDWAMHRTSTWQDAERQMRAYAAEEKLHPIAVPMHNNPPAAAELVRFVPVVAELGPGWYDSQRPSVVGPRSGARGAEVRFVKASRTQFGWDFERTLQVHVLEGNAAGQVLAVPGQAAHVTSSVRAGGVRFRVRTLASGSMVASATRGPLRWEVLYLNGRPTSLISAAERDAVLALVAKRIAH